MTQPKARRPQHMSEYDVNDNTEGMMTWADVVGRITPERNYWLCVVRPDGRPHVSPVWGVWMDDTLYFTIHESARKIAYLAANPQIAVHLEDGDDVVILEGKAEKIDDSATIERMKAIYQAKYDFDLNTEPGMIYYRLLPARGLTWQESSMSRSATRFDF